MADLTETLSVPMSGKETLAPPKTGPGIFSSLLGAVGTAVDTYEGGQQTRDRMNARARQRAQDARQARLDAQKAEEDSALNEAAAEEIDAVVDPGEQAATVAAAEEAGSLATHASAVQQGRARRDQVEVRTQAALRRLFAKYPNQRAAILGQFDKHGLMSPIMADYNRASKAVSEDEELRQKTYETWYNKSVELGLDPSTMPETEFLTLGRQALEAEHMLDLKVKNANLNATLVSTARTQSEDARDDTSEETYQAAINFASPQFQAAHRTVFNMMMDPNIPPSEKEPRMTEMVRSIQTLGQQRIENIMARAGGSMKPERREELRKTLTNQLNNITQMYTGPLGDVQASMRGLQLMQNELKMNVTTALPLFNQLKESFGLGMVSGTEMESFIKNTVLGGPNAAALKKELQGFNFNDRGDARRHIANAVAILKGEKNLKDLTPAEARQQLPSMLGHMEQLTQNEAVRTGVNATAHRQAVLAAGAVFDGMGDAVPEWGVRNLTGLVMRTANRNVNQLLFSGPPKANGDLVPVVRDVALPGMQNVIESLRKAPTGDQFFRIAMDNRTGRVVAEPTGRPRPRAGNNMIGKIGPTSENYGPNELTQMKVKALNMALDWMSGRQSNGYDKDVPANLGLTDIERRRLYGLGEVPEKLRQKENAGSPSSKKVATWGENVDRAIKETMDAINNEEFTPGQFTLGHGQDRVVNYEAKGKTGITHVPASIQTLGDLVTWGKGLINNHGVSSTASGLFQITQSTYEEFGEQALGKNWRNAPLTPENQEAVARAIFNDAKSKGPTALRRRWVSLSRDEAAKLMNSSWEEARDIIIKGESA